jgi:hypothetical protein
MGGLKGRKVYSYHEGRIHRMCITKLKEADEEATRTWRWRCERYRELTKGMEQ